MHNAFFILNKICIFSVLLFTNFGIMGKQEKKIVRVNKDVTMYYTTEDFFKKNKFSNSPNSIKIREKIKKNRKELENAGCSLQLQSYTNTPKTTTSNNLPLMPLQTAFNPLPSIQLPLYR
jgi:hypothetical protein